MLQSDQLAFPTVFNILRTKLAHSLFFVPPVIKAKVSLDRITDFLTEVCPI